MKGAGSNFKAVFINALRRLRYFKYYKKFPRCGQNVLLCRNGFILRPEQMSVGNNVYISGGFYISAHELIIGNDVLIGPNIVIECSDHITDRVGIPMVRYRNCKRHGGVVIEDDVWIGANVTVLRNTRICEGAIVGACSLVNKDIPPYTIAFGTPAKVFRRRFDNESLKKHLDMVKSKYTHDQVLNHFAASGIVLGDEKRVVTPSAAFIL